MQLALSTKHVVHKFFVNKVCSLVSVHDFQLLAILVEVFCLLQNDLRLSQHAPLLDVGLKVALKNEWLSLSIFGSFVVCLLAQW